MKEKILNRVHNANKHFVFDGLINIALYTSVQKALKPNISKSTHFRKKYST